MKSESTFSALLQSYFTDRLMRQRGASPNTIANYRDTFRVLIEFADRKLKRRPTDLTIEDIDAPFVCRFLNHLEEERGNSSRSRNVRLAAIHSFFHYVALKEPAFGAVAQRVLAIQSKRFAKRPVDFLTRAEAEALLGAPNQNTWSGRRDRTLLLLALQTGLRVSEVIALRDQDVVLGTGAHVRCLGKGRKTRCIPLRKDTATALHLWLRERCASSADVVFPNARGQALSRDGVEYLITKHARSACAACPSLESKRVSPHVLRHTTAMNLLEHGVDTSVIALWLGHEKMETTQAYLHASIKLKECALLKTEMFKGQSRRYHPPDQLRAFLQSL
jgi:integrase/recombinase XerD